MLIVKRDGSLTTTQYWDALPPPVAEIRTDNEHKEEILRLLRDSITKRMMSDVPLECSCQAALIHRRTWH